MHRKSTLARPAEPRHPRPRWIQGSGLTTLQSLVSTIDDLRLVSPTIAQHTVFRLIVTTPDSPSTADTYHLPSREPLIDQHRRADRHARIEVDHVGHPHADAAVRGGAADRARVAGAVDADAVGDAEPA